MFFGHPVPEDLMLRGHPVPEDLMFHGTPCIWRSNVYWDTLYLMSVQLGEQSYLLNVAWDDYLKMLSQSSWFYWNFLTIEYFLRKCYIDFTQYLLYRTSDLLTFRPTAISELRHCGPTSSFKTLCQKVRSVALRMCVDQKIYDNF